MTYGHDELDAYDFGHKPATRSLPFVGKRLAGVPLNTGDLQFFAGLKISLDDVPSPEGGAGVPPTSTAPLVLPEREDYGMWTIGGVLLAAVGIGVWACYGIWRLFLR